MASTPHAVLNLGLPGDGLGNLSGQVTLFECILGLLHITRVIHGRRKKRWTPFGIFRNFQNDLSHMIAKLGYDWGELRKMREVPEVGEMAKKKRICETAARKRFVKSVNHVPRRNFLSSPGV